MGQGGHQTGGRGRGEGPKKTGMGPNLERKGGDMLASIKNRRGGGQKQRLAGAAAASPNAPLSSGGLRGSSPSTHPADRP